MDTESYERVTKDAAYYGDHQELTALRELADEYQNMVDGNYFKKEDSHE